MSKRFFVAGVDAHTALSEAAPAILVSKAEPLFKLEAAAAGGADVEAVHDMRVASRRLREAMRLLEPLYPRRSHRAWYRRIRDITRTLGPVRDSDVFIESFGAMATQLDEGGRKAVAFLVGLRTGQRVAELEQLNRDLARLDLKGARSAFRNHARTLSSDASADRPLSEFAYTEVAARAAVVFGAQPNALAEENMASQHALRIDYKRLRYAVEVFAPCYGTGFEPLYATLTQFQDALGDLHDAHVFLEMLQRRELSEAAARAGVDHEAIREIEQLLVARAHEHFMRFTELAARNPPEALLPRLLLPLLADADSAQLDTPAPQGALAVIVSEESDSGGSAGEVAPIIEMVLGPVPANPVHVVPVDELSPATPVSVGATPWDDEWDDEEYREIMG